MKSETDALGLDNRISATVLVVDDNVANLKVVIGYLKGSGLRILTAKNGKTAIERARDGKPDIILLDVLMPGMDGFETCLRLKSDAGTRDIPVIFMTALTANEHEIRGFQVGAVDYISKPIRQDRLMARITTHLRLRILAEQLEQKVRERTAELMSANEVLHREIAERKKVEESLRESEEKFRRIFETMQDGYLMTDMEGNILLANPAVEKMLHYSSGELLVKNLPAEIYDNPQERETFKKPISIRDGVKNYEIRLKRKDGQVIIAECNAHFVNGEDNAPVAIEGMIRDVTQRKRAEEELGNHRDHLEALVEERTVILEKEIAQHKLTEKELKEAKESAESANAAKSRFLSRMSHELRTPLNAIIGFAQLMERDPEVTSGQREKVEIINHSGRHLLALINDVLDMSKIEVGRTALKKSIFDLRRMLNGIEQMIRMRAKMKNLDFTCVCSGDVPQYVRTDKHKLRQILINLLNNAVKYTEKGSVELRVRLGREYGEKDIRAPLCFELEDTGIGIPPDETDAIFTAFAQSERIPGSDEGTGLGLAISRKFANLMDGDITVRSRVGEGSVFTLNIIVEPADMADSDADDRIGRVAGLEPGQPAYRILIVEDVAESRLLLSKLLKMIGFDVRDAKNGAEAIGVFGKWHPHLILMDIRMPVMNGLEATRKIKSETEGKKTPIIALTASSFEEDRSEILSAGCDDYIRKPFRENELFEAIERQLGVVYTHEYPVARNGGQTSRIGLCSSDMERLPADWLTKFGQAVLLGDEKPILDLINRIRSDHSDVAETLENHVREFRFDKLLALTNQSIL